MVIKVAKSVNFNIVEKTLEYCTGYSENEEYYELETVSDNVVKELSDSGLISQVVRGSIVFMHDSQEDSNDAEDCENDSFEGARIKYVTTGLPVGNRDDVDVCIKHDGRLMIVTKQIEYDSMNLGRYLITINIDEPSDYTIDPLDFKLSTSEGVYSHPHILNEDICLGSVQANVADCVDNKDVDGVATMLIEFLYGIDEEDDWGSNVTYWPEV